MSIQKRLEQSILNAVIHYAYTLSEDEKDALLSAFLEMSYKIHKEAVECMLPDNDYEQLVSARMDASASPPGNPPLETATVSLYHESLISRHLHSICRVFRNREDLLQEEEELALFGTIEEISRQVNREAIDKGIFLDIAGEGRFAAAYERIDAELSNGSLMPVREEIAVSHVRSDTRGRRRGTMDTYAEFMEDDYTFIGGIIERNREVSQGYLNAQAV